MDEIQALRARLELLVQEHGHTDAQHPPPNEELHVTAALRDRMMALPQELFDEIYNLTFTADKQVRHITNALSGRPPHLLHVDRHSRKKFAASYYRNTTFLFPCDILFARWLRALKHVPGTAFAALYIRTPPPRPALRQCKLPET
ncbi:hypothetical protein CERZMDRAFT_93040 [Cercospora zeae-maydis SCOH1-5]|uniref:F-box domain-containing protein n=1 Tax=Cercospora zeae-maydis SCOH1-5 TaxID=717836 RepID=A0A6A6FU03_9PEZI|nr:hypothetical protein CERZMDRAFT_93040 [Cercospora zeae-maydis SCOH1-5]